MACSHSIYPPSQLCSIVTVRSLPSRSREAIGSMATLKAPLGPDASSRAGPRSIAAIASASAPQMTHARVRLLRQWHGGLWEGQDSVARLHDGACRARAARVDELLSASRCAQSAGKG